MALGSLARPQITLREQLARNIANRGKEVPCRVFTPLGNPFKAVQVIGRSLAEIRQIAVEIDLKRSSSSSFHLPDLCIRRQGVRVKANRGKQLPYNLVTYEGNALRVDEVLAQPLSAIEALSARVNALRALKTKEILWTPLPAMERLADRIRGIESLSLADLGKAVEVAVGRTTWEVLIGIEVARLEKEGIKLEEVIGRSLWAVTNEKGMLVNIDEKEARAVVDSINQKFGLGVELANEEVSEAVSDRFFHQLLTWGIFWYHDGAGQKVVKNVYIRGIDPKAHPQFGGLLIGRPKA